MKYFAWAVCLVVAAAVVASFFFIGSPADRRLEKLDEKRINDLSSIQNEIINYWQQKSKLPDKLVELNNDLNYFTVPRDTENNKDYTYEVLGQYQFKLCADFSTENVANQAYPTPVTYGVESKWPHSKGNVCFTRTIDPELFKANSTIPAKPFR
ncbi:MAG: hypothetical protein AAB659_01800 [Patescibacteria group bacterium]